MGEFLRLSDNQFHITWPATEKTFQTVLTHKHIILPLTNCAIDYHHSPSCSPVSSSIGSLFIFSELSISAAEPHTVSSVITNIQFVWLS